MLIRWSYGSAKRFAGIVNMEEFVLWRVLPWKRIGSFVDIRKYTRKFSHRPDCSANTDYYRPSRPLMTKISRKNAFSVGTDFLVAFYDFTIHLVESKKKNNRILI